RSATFGIRQEGELAMNPTTSTPDDLAARLQRDFLDGLDEELELELEDQISAEPKSPEVKAAEKDSRRIYFKDLLRLQSELIKVQDWVVSTKSKIVVIFEGRDAAGKGGAIKRVAQRLNPRVCRIAALPAPTERERSQWYFQRYVAHLPA